MQGHGSLDEQHPWPGLRPFTEHDSAFFFGREHEVQALLERVERHPVVVLYGQSGLGKTSLLRAGLFPRLKQPDQLPVWVRFEHAEDAPPLARQILEALARAFAAAGVEAAPPQEGESLWSYLHRQDVEFWGPRNRLVTPLIVLDQFEELFTLGQRTPRARERSDALMAELEAQFEQRPPAAVRTRLQAEPSAADAFDFSRQSARFVLSLREDYLPHLDAWRERLPSMLVQRLRLEPMGTAQALEVVARAGQALLDERVARDIVAFVAGDGSSVEPALLSVICDELNRRRLHAGLPRITPALLSDERSRIVADFYERAFEGVDDGVRDWVEDELLTASGHRDRAAVEDARRAGIDIDGLRRLVDRRLLHSDQRQKVEWVELTHDLLTAPAMDSRNARQARRAEAERAALAEREAAERAARDAAGREKLKRARRLSALFGVLALVMAGGLAAVYVYWQRAEQATVAANEARRAESLAAARADSARLAAETATRREATTAAEALVTADRAQAAEGLARQRLDLSQASATQLARQGLEDLMREWIEPDLEAEDVLRQARRRFATLDAQFADAPDMPALQAQAAALAALVSRGRGDGPACDAQVAAAARHAARMPGASLAVLEARALVAHARAACEQLRGVPGSAEGQVRALALAAALPPGSALRQRLEVQSHIARAAALMQRLDHDAARQALAQAQAAIERNAAEGVTPLERSAWRVDAWMVAAEIDDDRGKSDAVWRAIEREIGGLDSPLRGRTDWRRRRASAETLEAFWHWRGDRSIEAEDALDTAIRLVEGLINSTAQPAPRWRAMLVSARRLQAELALAHLGEARSKIVLDQLRTEAEALRRIGLQSAWSEYTLALAESMERRRPGADDETRRQVTIAARDRLARVVAAAPEYGQAIRSLAIMHRELGTLAYEIHGRSPSAAAQGAGSTLLDQALAHYEDAIRAMAPLRGRVRQSQVADVLAHLAELQAQVAQRRGDRARRLQAYEEAAALYAQVPVTPDNRVDRALRATLPDLWRARLLREGGDVRVAQDLDARNEALLKRLLVDHPEHPGLMDRLAWLHRMAAADHLERGDRAETLARIEQAVDTLAAAAASTPMNRDIQKQVDDTQVWLRDTLRRQLANATGAGTMLTRVDALDQRLKQSQRPPAPTVVSAALPPAFPGDWQPLRPEALLKDDPRMRTVVDELAKAGWTAHGARRIQLPFYPSGTWLAEWLVRRADGTEGGAMVLAPSKGDLLRVGGSSPPLHAFNARHGLTLRQPHQASQYLRFFVAVLQSNAGLFRILEDPRDLLWEPTATVDAATRQDYAALVRPFGVERAPDDDVWLAAATMQVGSDLFQVKLALPRTGVPLMFNDLPERTSRWLVSEHYVDGVRVRTQAPALRVRLAAQAAARDWAGAARTQGEIVRDRSHAAVTQKDRNELLPDDTLQLAWYRLLARNFEGALEAAGQGLELEPESLRMQTHVAHALLLLGGDAEAEALYRANLGRTLPDSNGKTWQALVLEELDALEKGGLNHPRFDAIRRLMRETVPPPPAAPASAAR